MIFDIHNSYIRSTDPDKDSKVLQVGDERRTSDFRVADVVSVVTEEVPAQVTYTTC